MAIRWKRTHGGQGREYMVAMLVSIRNKCTLCSLIGSQGSQPTWLFALGFAVGSLRDRAGLDLQRVDPPRLPAALHLVGEQPVHDLVPRDCPLPLEGVADNVDREVRLAVGPAAYPRVPCVFMRVVDQLNLGRAQALRELGLDLVEHGPGRADEAQPRRARRPATVRADGGGTDAEPCTEPDAEQDQKEDFIAALE
eukprot:CAMPEP_0180362772 /NCGR_PEP_ID=MMETSP0989-20121125/13596_1 /TAXON_ID=697907 /ORGANISM="non described non described, Strain CCMP2293" /LENGTH=195 /DNA_ID=CAMNT_0022355015 /DNA_START=14 /DNA_END=599 /DNA_ORIENTATION=-